MNKANKNIIQAGSRISMEQIDTITAVIALIIPASDDGLMPGADELDIVTDIINEGDGSLGRLLEDINHLIEAAKLQYSRDFCSLDNGSKLQIIDSIKMTKAEYLQVLSTKTAVYYYQHDRVLEALGLELRPPFPKGNEVLAGDLSLLDPVRKRQPMYRE